MPDWRLGTMGFSYDDWSGPFYPKGLPAGDRLAFYARHFNSVELDTTFHAIPDAARMRKWADAVPDDFTFCAKVPRAVTHDLPGPQSHDAMRRFLDVTREMERKLGAVLLQFAPQYTADRFGDLEALLVAARQHSPDVRLAVELRNRSWGNRRTLDLLKAYNCCLVFAEYLARPGKVLLTSDYLYIRWIGEHGRYPAHTEEVDEMNESLAWWKEELLRVASQVQTIHGFFNNDYTGYSIPTCNRFKRMLGLPVVEPPPREKQGSLFE
jgi:uncharacterized protein YecE (DUF72 family)